MKEHLNYEKIYGESNIYKTMGNKSLQEGIKVSIITVVYNGANTIEQTIKSVINQTYDNIEYIIIDGGSSDGTCNIISMYRDSIAVFISEEDEGLYFAMNKGIRYATGEIVGIINSDDYYTDTAISDIVEYFNKYNVDVMYGNAILFDGQQETGLYICRDIEELWYKMAIPHPATFVKKDIYIEYGMFDTQYAIAADYDLLLRFYSKGVKFGHIEKTLAYFRKGGVSEQRLDDCIQEARQISLRYLKKCREKDKVLSKIREYYARRKFKQLIESKNKRVSDVLEIILKEYNVSDGIAIWGTGEWGERCYKLLKMTDLHVDFFVDNDPLKWGNHFHDVIIEAPKRLCNYEGILLIATFKYEEEIKEQLKTLNEQLAFFSLLEWADNVAKDVSEL